MYTSSAMSACSSCRRRSATRAWNSADMAGSGRDSHCILPDNAKSGCDCSIAIQSADVVMDWVDGRCQGQGRRGGGRTLASRHRTQAVLRLIRVGSFIRIGPGISWPVGGDSSVSPACAMLRTEKHRSSAANSSRKTRQPGAIREAGKGYHDRGCRTTPDGILPKRPRCCHVPWCIPPQCLALARPLGHLGSPGSHLGAFSIPLVGTITPNHEGLRMMGVKGVEISRI